MSQSGRGVLKKVFTILFSTRLTAAALIAFAVAMAVATFIENDYGVAASKALVYNAKWFELLMVALAVNFVGNIFTYRLYRKGRRATLLFHVAFIVILLGAFISRYFGFEGMVFIRERQQTNRICSDKTYVQLVVDDNTVMRRYEKEAFFAALAMNHYRLRDSFGQNVKKIHFSVALDEFVPHAEELFEPDSTGPSVLSLVRPSDAGRLEIYLMDGETRYIDHIPFAFNRYVVGGVNFFQEGDQLTIQSPFNGQLMEMQTMKATPVQKDSLSSLRLRSLYSFGGLKFVAKRVAKGRRIYRPAPKEKHAVYPDDMARFTIRSGGQEEKVSVMGRKGALPQPHTISLNGLNFTLSYGAKEIKMPFFIKLRDFQMERYPGTNSASSYASEITVIDLDTTFDHRIFMNHVLDYRGYRFFQSSYDHDEQGTILSVNHDRLGTYTTYVGYALMAIGMFATLFMAGSRFGELSQKLRNLRLKKVLPAALWLVSPALLYAQPTPGPPTGVVSRAHAETFGRLLIQDHQGRIKPVNAYALEALRKIYKKSSYEGLTAEQVLLTSQIDPQQWSHRYIIKVRPKLIGQEASKALKTEHGLTSMANCFVKGKYYFENRVEEAVRTEKTSRNATEQEIIDIDERINIWWSALNGDLLQLYPKRGDPNHKWYAGSNQLAFVGQDTMVLKMHQLYLAALRQAVKQQDYSSADEYLGLIAQYQQNLAADIIPPPQKVTLEIAYNRLNIFNLLLFYYLTVGVALLFLAFLDLFRPALAGVRLALNILLLFTLAGLLAHALGLGARWYIAGHAPWGNGYEAVVFVAFTTVLAGVIFSYRKSQFTLASTVIFASFLLGIAQGSMMNPEITNLVPVLKSYWLMIHVAVITASYGFLGLGALLGLVVLALYILRTPQNAARLNTTIRELTYTNESALTVGLFALSIGTFLGGVWANESWGRYWSWDPKEVWALISVMVYVFVLHMRMFPGLKGPFAFNVASLFSISTLIMTFFGVNYYLSGMHSYAGGDPVPIPAWIYLATAFFVLFAVLSYIRYKRFESSDA